MIWTINLLKFHSFTRCESDFCIAYQWTEWVDHKKWQTKWAIWTKQWRLLLKQIQFQILRLLHLFNFISLAQHILQHWILHFWNAIFLQYQHCSPIYILWKIVSIETLASPMKQLKCKYVTRMWLYAQRTSTMEKYKWRTLQWQIRNTTCYSRL